MYGLKMKSNIVITDRMCKMLVSKDILPSTIINFSLRRPIKLKGPIMK
jgi:hypothetical protein